MNTLTGTTLEPTYTSKNCKANNKASVSCSMVEYRDWHGLNFLEKKLIGRSTPSSSSCKRTAPAPTILASTSSLKGLSKLGAVSTGALQSSAFADPKAELHSADHLKGILGLSKVVRGATTVEKFLQKVR